MIVGNLLRDALIKASLSFLGTSFPSLLLLNCMCLLSLKNFKLYCLSISLIISVNFLCKEIKAADLLERDYPESNYNEVFDYDNHKSISHPVKKTHRKLKNDPLVLQDSVFRNGGNVSINDLVLKVSMVSILLLTILGLVKIFVSRNRFSQVGSVLDEFAQKFSGSLSSFSGEGLKLKQTLVLTPGQNLYLVEVEGKKLLLGATHHGGVHFLADMTSKNIKLNNNTANQIAGTENLSNMPMTGNSSPNQDMKTLNGNGHFKHVDMFSKTLTENPFSNVSHSFQEEPKPELVHEQRSEEQPEVTLSKANSKPTLKKRTNYRQYLFNELTSRSEKITV